MNKQLVLLGKIWNCDNVRVGCKTQLYKQPQRYGKIVCGAAKFLIFRP